MWPLKSYNNFQKVIFILVSCGFSYAQALPLYEAVSLGLDNNLSLHASEKGIEENKYNIAISRSKFLPSLNAQADTTWSDNRTIFNISPDARDQYNSHSYSVSLSLSLFDATNLVQYQTAKLNYNIEQLKHQNQVQQIIYQVSSDYFEYLKINAQIRATKAELVSATTNEKQLIRHIELGNKPANDIYEAIGQKQSVMNRLMSLEKEKNIILSNLETKIQFPIVPNQDLQSDMTLSGIPKNKNKQIQDNAKFNNEVLIAKKNLENSHLSLKESKTQFVPDVSVSASYRDDDANNYDITDPDASGKSSGALMSLNVNIPLFAGGANYYGLEKSKTAIERTELLYHETLLSKRNEIDISILTINTLSSSIEHLENIMLANQATYNGIKKAYQLGTRTVTDLLASESKLFNAVRDYENARYDYLLEIIRLQQLQGMLSLTVIEDISSKLITNKSNFKNKDLVPQHLTDKKIAPRFNVKIIK